MEYKIPEEIIDEVRLRADIVETISEYVYLQRKGKNYLGICPFHSEKTPSFTVTPDKQIFYCFGCHTGGNVISFLMKKENWTFLETVQHLAQKYSIALPEKEVSPREREEQKRKRRWEEIHDWASAYFQEVLLDRSEGEPGREYFARRGIDETTIRAFRLGYAPNRWDGLLEAMLKRGVKAEELAEAGLALEREAAQHTSTSTHKFYDRFRNRVMFSIIDNRQRVIGFGGRVMDDSQPKYLNSPETAFFSKGHHLYGMHKAYQGIREEGLALLAEGYMDVIALQKVGFTSAVASLGTALTKDQAKLLRRYTQRVVICYDTDPAGTQAAIRAGEILRGMGIRVDVLTLPETKDPDEFLNKHPAADFRELLNRVKTYVEFKYQILAKEHPIQNIRDKAELVAKLAPDIQKVASSVEREGYERFLSLELGLTLEAVQREITSLAQDKAGKKRENEYSPERQDISVKNRDNINRQEQAKSVSVPQKIYRAERTILRLVAENLNFATMVEQELGQDFWRVEGHRRIFEAITGGKQNGSGMPAILDEAVESQLAGVLFEDVDLSQPERLLDDCIRSIRGINAEESVEELQRRMEVLEKAGDMAGAMALLREIGERLRRGE